MRQRTTKTIVFAAGAVLLLLLAMWSRPVARVPEEFEDVGQELFPEFTDPAQAAALEIIEYRTATASTKAFRVHRRNDLWTIPSHHDYPADAKDRMAKAAGLFIGLRKEDRVSDSPQEHAAFGVQDPRDLSIQEGGSGLRVTFEDENGNALASLILGKAVEGRGELYYVRQPERKRVYVARLPAQLSAEFKDWIETDLLQVGAWDLKKLTFDSYSVDEQSGVKLAAVPLTVTRQGQQWSLADLAEDEEINSTVISEVTSTLDNLQIIGVRRKPTGLSAQLTRAEGVTLNQEALLSLQYRGFYVTNDGQLLANEGDLYASTEKGVVYTLRFGEVLFGSDDDITAGAAQEGQERSEGAETEGLRASRFLMVSADFDPTLLSRPGVAALPVDHLEKRRAARTGIEMLLEAVERYRTQHGALPATLEQLAQGDTPLLPSLDPDPWGNPYVYRRSGGDAESFSIASLAEDGAESGTGVGLDIQSDLFLAEDALHRAAEDQTRYEEQVKTGQELAQQLRNRFAPWYYVIDEDSFKKLRRDRAGLVQKKATPDEQ